MEFLLIIIIAVIGMGVQWRLQAVFKKYSRVLAPGGMTGHQIAEKMLRDNGIRDVSVVSTPGSLTDHYDPSKKRVNLSESVYGTNSVSAAAVAAHECGHAVQDAEGYAPLRLRSALVPIVQFSSMWAQLIIILGIILIKTTPLFFWVGIALFAMILIFSVITLPVEYNASRCALVWLESSGTLRQEELAGAKEALNWAARTYLVAALSALASLIYYLGIGKKD